MKGKKSNRTSRINITVGGAGQPCRNRIRTLRYKENDPTFKDHWEILYDCETFGICSLILYFPDTLASVVAYISWIFLAKCSTE